MGLRANAKSSSRDGLHQKVAMSSRHMEAIASEVILTDEAGAKADSPLMAKMKKGPIVGKNVPAEDRGGFAEYNAALVNVFCQV